MDGASKDNAQIYDDLNCFWHVLSLKAKKLVNDGAVQGSDSTTEKGIEAIALMLRRIEKLDCIPYRAIDGGINAVRSLISQIS
jgi:hypothetical protein